MIRGTRLSRRVALSLMAILVGCAALSGVAAQATVSDSQPGWTSAQWAGGTGRDDGNAVASTGGAPVVAGHFTGVAYFPKTAALDDSLALRAIDDSQDVFVAGMNAAGTYFTWALRAGGPGESWAQSVAVIGTSTVATSDDTVLVVGEFDGTLYFPTGVADDSLPLTSKGDRDAFVAAVKPGGSGFAWATRVGSPTPSSDRAAGMSIALTRDDTPIIAGYFTGTASFPKRSGSIALTSATQTAFVAAMNKDDSTFSWAQMTDSTMAVIGDVVAVSGTGSASLGDDTILLTGSIFGTTYFPTGRSAPDDSIALTPMGMSSVYVAALNTDDTYFAWAQMVGGDGSMSGALAVDSSDTPLITGQFSGTAYFPTGGAPGDDSIALVSSGADDAYVAAMGNDDSYFVWARKVGGSGSDSGLGIAITEDDTPVVTGSFEQTATFTTASGSIILSRTAGALGDAFVAALNPGASTFAWAQQAGATSGSRASGLAVAIVGDDTSVVVGNLTGSASFPTSSSPISITARGNQDVFVGIIAPAASSTPAPSPAPVPNPIYPASAPTGVKATAGDASAAVSWTAPSSAGSYPVTSYSVTSSPAGGSCMATAPALACDVKGLVNGTTYTFRVRALNGAGWSEESAPSNAVTPQGSAPPVAKSITIVGSRNGVRIEVNGTSEGIDPGTILKPWIRFAGQSTYAQGAADIPVGAKGEFAWDRRAPKKTYVYVQTADGTIRSNSVVIPAR